MLPARSIFVMLPIEPDNLLAISEVKRLYGILIKAARGLILCRHGLSIEIDAVHAFAV